MHTWHGRQTQNTHTTHTAENQHAHATTSCAIKAGTNKPTTTQPKSAHANNAGQQYTPDGKHQCKHAHATNQQKYVSASCAEKETRQTEPMALRCDNLEQLCPHTHVWQDFGA